MNLVEDKIVHLLTGKSNLREVSVAELEGITQEKPFFSVAQLLLAKKMKQENHPAFPQQVAKTALYFPNTYWLDLQLQDSNATNTLPAAGPSQRVYPAVQAPIHTEVIAAGATEDRPPLPGEEPVEEQSGSPGLSLPNQAAAPVENNTAGPAATGSILPPAYTELLKTTEADDLPTLRGVALVEEKMQDSNLLLPGLEAQPVKAAAPEPVAGDRLVLAETGPGLSQNIKTPLPAQESATINHLAGEIPATPAVPEQADPVEELPPAAPMEEVVTTITTETTTVYEQSIRDSFRTSGQLAQPGIDEDDLPVDEIGEIPPSNQAMTNIKLAEMLQEQAATFHKPIEPDASLPIDTEPYHTIDYFASQGIKLESETAESDALGKKVRKFTDWLKQMKRISPQPGDLGTENELEQAVLGIAAHSNEARDIVTEAMAEVLVKQGKTDKAVQLYAKLSFLNPAKSAYFAAKILALKET